MTEKTMKYKVTLKVERIKDKKLYNAIPGRTIEITEKKLFKLPGLWEFLEGK